MTEIWKIIPQFPAYAASSQGRIKRIVKAKRGSESFVGRTLKPRTHRAGYKEVVVYKNGVGRSRLVHHLVAFAFISPRPTPRHEIAHWNGKSDDNRPNNLRWSTGKENSKDKIRHGRNFRKIQGLAELRKIRRAYAKGEAQSDIAKRHNISQCHVSYLCSERFAYV